jgi:hypothetical protein
MALYFFHLSSGDRVCRDEEGAELPSRSAARAEALAVLRDLTHSEAGESRWAGWLLRVEDAAGQFFCSPIGHPGLALVADNRPGEPERRPNRPIGEVAADLALRLAELNALLERNQRLREQLASEFLFSKRVKLRARAASSYPPRAMN